MYHLCNPTGSLLYRITCSVSTLATMLANSPIAHFPTLPSNSNLPTSAEVIMLFLSSFPHVVLLWDVVQDTSDCSTSKYVRFELKPVNSPQNIHVAISLFLPHGNAEMKLESDITSFEWENWMNAAMGLMKGWGELLTRHSDERKDYAGPLRLIKQVDLSRSVVSKRIHGLSEPINQWSGWHLFEARICQFERDQFIKAGGRFIEPGPQDGIESRVDEENTGEVPDPDHGIVEPQEDDDYDLEEPEDDGRNEEEKVHDDEFMKGNEFLETFDPVSTNIIPFPRATVSLRSDKSNSDPRSVWFAISAVVRWKYVEADTEAPPTSLFNFRDGDFLALERLPAVSTWEDVQEVVRSVDTQQGPGLIITGRLFSRRRIRHFRPIELIVTADSVDQRNSWVEAVRVRVSPWQLLFSRFKNELEVSLADEVLREIFTMSEKESVHADRGHVDRANIIADFIRNIAKSAKANVPFVKEGSEATADVTRCVYVVMSAFTSAVICTSLVETFMEIKRGTAELPRFASKLDELRESIVQVLVPVLYPNGQVDEVLLKHYFEVQESSLSILAEIEREIMAGAVSRQSLPISWWLGFGYFTARRRIALGRHISGTDFATKSSWYD